MLWCCGIITFDFIGKEWHHSSNIRFGKFSIFSSDSARDIIAEVKWYCFKASIAACLKNINATTCNVYSWYIYFLKVNTLITLQKEAAARKYAAQELNSHKSKYSVYFEEIMCCHVCEDHISRPRSQKLICFSFWLLLSSYIFVENFFLITCSWRAYTPPTPLSHNHPPCSKKSNGQKSSAAARQMADAASRGSAHSNLPLACSARTSQGGELLQPPGGPNVPGGPV